MRPAVLYGDMLPLDYISREHYDEALKIVITLLANF